LLAVYVGRQAEPFDEFPIFSLTFAFSVSMLIACFKGLMYLQQRADGLPMSYEVLFTNSWRNFLTAVLASLFVFVFWLILLLWGSLFNLIGLDFFKNLFRKDWFLIPVLTFAFGLGVILFRNLTHVIDSISKLLHGLIKLLLPLVMLLAVIFLGSLPFVGLNLLWSTGKGTELLLCLSAVTIFFINAVYQDGREGNPYTSYLHKFMYIGILSLLVLSILSFYGLTLRIEQYGWTVERCWAVLVWLVLTLFSIGYVWGVITQGFDWPKYLAKVNVFMGLVVLALMLLVNSPLLDFRKISLNSQLARVESNQIGIEDFDYYYARRHLARPGFLAVNAIKDEHADDAKLLTLIKTRSTRYLRRDGVHNFDKFWADVVFRPEPFEVPEQVKDYVNEYAYNLAHYKVVLLKRDLDNDDRDEYLMFQVNRNENQHIYTSKYFYFSEDEWHEGYLNIPNKTEHSSVVDDIVSGEVELVAPKYMNIKIGDILIQPNQTN